MYLKPQHYVVKTLRIRDRNNQDQISIRTFRGVDIIKLRKAGQVGVGRTFVLGMTFTDNHTPQYQGVHNISW